jgi:hypothetical protein
MIGGSGRPEENDGLRDERSESYGGPRLTSDQDLPTQGRNDPWDSDQSHHPQRGKRSPVTGNPGLIGCLRVPGTDSRCCVPTDQTGSGLACDEQADHRQENHGKEQDAQSDVLFRHNSPALTSAPLSCSRV